MAKESHHDAAEHHDKAAKAHRTAAEHHDKGDHAKAHEHADGRSHGVSSGSRAFDQGARQEQGTRWWQALGAASTRGGKH